MRTTHVLSKIVPWCIALSVVVEASLGEDPASILVPEYRPVDAPTTPWKVLERFLRGHPRDAKLSDYEALSKEKPKEPLPPPTDTSEITVAIYGDSGMNVDAQRVFRAAREDADMVLHVGDFAYEFAGANEFNTAISSIFGNAFPYITTVGDHGKCRFGDVDMCDFLLEWSISNLPWIRIPPVTKCPLPPNFPLPLKRYA